MILNGMKIIKKPLDPIATRISIGGIQGQNYIVYRGSINDVRSLLKCALIALSVMHKEPETDCSEFGGS